MDISAIRETFLLETIQFVPNSKIFLLPLTQSDDFFKLKTPETFGMHLVSLDPINIQAVELEDMASKLALTGQGLKFLIEEILKIAIGHNMFNQDLIVLPKFRLIRVAVN